MLSLRVFIIFGSQAYRSSDSILANSRCHELKKRGFFAVVAFSPAKAVFQRPIVLLTRLAHMISI